MYGLRGGKRGLSSADQAETVPKRYRDHDINLIESVVMDAITEEMDECCETQSSEVAQFVRKPRERLGTQPGARVEQYTIGAM